MNSVNIVVIGGNLTRKPELKAVGDTNVTNFSVALNRKYATPSGVKEEVHFIEVIAWGKTAEYICQYGEKGAYTIVQGRLEVQNWIDKNTQQKRSKTRVVADSLSLENRNRGNQSSSDPDEDDSPL